MGDEEATDPIIDMREDGPLLAKHLPQLQDRDGSELSPRPLAPLCRCGASANKPYCDGSHRDTGFKTGGPADAAEDRVKVYAGQDVTVHYNPLLCSHAAECVRRGGGAFDPSLRPWINPDRADTKSIRDAVQACPSGALRISDPDGSPHHLNQGMLLSVEVEPNGPYRVRNVPLASDLWPEGATQTKYVLCRCGKSGNLPLCDGTHSDENWKDGSDS